LPVFSVLTACYRPLPEHLEAACASVIGQEMPPGWTLEWVVQQDGMDHPQAAGILPDHAVIRLGGNRKLSVAHTRNLGLVRA